jgi:hypothetical protein
VRSRSYSYAALAIVVFPKLPNTPGQRINMAGFSDAMLQLFQLGVGDRPANNTTWDSELQRALTTPLALALFNSRR